MPRQKPQIEIPDPLLREKNFVKEFQEKLLNISESFKFYNNVIVAVFLLGFLVLIFTLVTIVYQSWVFNLSFQRESTQLKNQEDLIINTVEQQKIMIQTENDINSKLDKIENSLKK